MRTPAPAVPVDVSVGVPVDVLVDVLHIIVPGGWGPPDERGRTVTWRCSW